MLAIRLLPSYGVAGSPVLPTTTIGPAPAPVIAERGADALTMDDLARAAGVEMPITEQMYAILYQGRDVREAVRTLMGRDLKRE